MLTLAAVEDGLLGFVDQADRGQCIRLLHARGHVGIASLLVADARGQPAAHPDIVPEMVLAGRVRGAGFGQASAETWEWDGNAWTRREPAHVPPADRGHALAYDHHRRRVVLFAGTGETWEWDGTDWSQRLTPTAPPWRWRCSSSWARWLPGSSPPTLHC